MALSEHEQKLLAEMEAALAADDPRLVGALSGKARTRQASRVLTGLLGVLVGLAVVLAGLVAKSTVVGVVGFIISLIGAFTVISNFSLRQMMGKNTATKKRSPGWGDRLERRWDDRNNQ